MSGAVAAIATAVSAAAANAAAFAGASSAIIEGVSTFAYTAASIGVVTGVSAGIGAIFAPKIPDPQALQTPLKQPMPVRQSAFGRVRVAGAYALYAVGDGSGKNVSYDVLALLDGKSNAIASYYLNDDLMAKTVSGNFWWAPGASGKYGGGGSNEPNLVQIDSRLGADTETAYAISSSVALWTSGHRGDGVTSMLLRCKQAKREDQAGDFPNGLPQPSAVIDSQLIYDPRDGGQTQGTASTYKYSDNPILCLLAYLTDASGAMGLDYTRFLSPSISAWEAAADECDGLVTTSGMHATLLDAAAAGDTTIFLADQTGLSAGVVISLPTEDVTVSSLGLAGEVDLTGTLTYAHTAGELAYWAGTGQSTRYSCAGTYRHDTPPGDTVKTILSTFDGWLGQKGDGSLIVRTNTIYAPTVVLTDKHILGYQVQHYLPDEQATNQFIVSYTDPASAFNKAEAGYVQDDADIASRGQVRSSELYLQWVPSGPQAIAVGRAILARSTQPLRGTLTCNLAGLAVMGERYVGVQIPELSDLSDAIVEVTGKLQIDLQTMQVTFPFVKASSLAVGGTNQALCFMIDVSKGAPTTPASLFTKMQEGLANALTLIGASIGTGLDLAVVACGDTGTATSIVKRSASAADVAAIIAWVDALTLSTDPLFSAPDAATAIASFFSGTSGAITSRRVIWLWQGSSDAQSPALSGSVTAGATLSAISPPALVNVITTEGLIPAELAAIDNTPDDGYPFCNDPATIEAAIEQAVFGSSSTPGSGYTLPPLAPPSGSPLQPLVAPTITSVTPSYPSSGGGVTGARLDVVMVAPGGNVTWRLQWKLSTDTTWTLAGTAITADGSPPEFLTGLIAATGSINVQVAYEAGSQVSDWSATTTVTVAAATAVVTDTATASEALSAGHICNLYNSSGAKVQKANATDLTKPANGFVLASVASSGSATVYMPGQYITGLSSLTPGATYYLSTTGGAITTTCPSSAGNGAQEVGVADSTGTKLFFNPKPMTGV